MTCLQKSHHNRYMAVVYAWLMGIWLVAGSAVNAQQDNAQQDNAQQDNAQQDKPNQISPSASADSIDEMLAQLSSNKTKDQAIAAIVKYSKKNEDSYKTIVKSLSQIARLGEDLVQRGWAIAALAEIGGLEIDEILLNIHSDEKQEDVVRNWAAAARVSMTRTTAGLIEKANLVNQFPSLGRPIGLRLIEQMSGENNARVEDMIEVTTTVPQLAQALAPAIMARNTDELVNTMLTASDQNVRRMAASFVATKAQQGSTDIADPIIEVVKFDADANAVPWQGGPLFIPQIAWGEDDSRALVGNLIRWMVWCDTNNDSKNTRVIHNNIRSLALANAAGYKSPGWNDADVRQWLIAWGNCRGRAEIEAILNEQEIKNKYDDVLDSISNR